MFKFIRAMLRKHAAKKVAKAVAIKWRTMADMVESPECVRLLTRMLMVVSDNQEAIDKIIAEAKQAFNEMGPDKAVLMTKLEAMAATETQAYEDITREVIDEAEGSQGG